MVSSDPNLLVPSAISCLIYCMPLDAKSFISMSTRCLRMWTLSILLQLKGWCQTNIRQKKWGTNKIVKDEGGSKIMSQNFIGVWFSKTFLNKNRWSQVK